MSIVSIEQRPSGAVSGDNYCVETVSVTGITGAVFEKIHSWPIPVTVLTMAFNANSSHVGDTIWLQASPTSAIGLIPLGSVTGASTFDVSSTVLDYMVTGTDMYIVDGSGEQWLGRCVSRSAIDGTVTTEYTTSRAFASPTAVYMRNTVTRNYIVESEGRNTLGFDKITGTYLPANMPMRITYYNSEPNITKTFYVHVEYLW